MKILITEKISENRFKDGNGYLIIRNNVIARTGKQVYKHNQVHEDSDDYYTDVEVDRPYNEVFSQQTIASFENTPITILHPEQKVNPTNIKELGKGFARDIKQGVAVNPETGLEEPVLMATTIITDAQAIEEVESGKWTHWSCGYDTQIEFVGDQAIQTKIRGNHIALCTTPRAGKITSIADEQNKTHVPHFIQALTDAVIAQANKKTMNDALSQRWRDAEEKLRILFTDLKRNSTTIDRVFREISASMSDSLHITVITDNEYKMGEDVLAIVKSKQSQIETIYNNKIREIKLLRISHSSKNQMPSVIIALRFVDNIWKDSIEDKHEYVKKLIREINS